jgi:predicted TIM-barrel fold metal-dependent hydrolase
VKIIDFRMRPPLGSFLQSRIYAAADNRNRYTRSLGFEPPASAERQSIDLLLEEMDAAGIARGVVVGRNSPTLGVIPNDDVVAMCARYPDRFVPVGSIDPTNRKAAMQAIDEAVALGVKAINIEPGVAAPPLHSDDRRLYPIYAHCEDQGIVLIVMSGGAAGPDISYTAPEHIDRVLGDFPTLKIVASHGNWPWVQEIIHVAFRRANLYLSPDMYLHGLPGTADYVTAINGFLADRFLFGTAYPFCPLDDYLARFLALPIRESVLERVLHDNAAALLGLD